MEHSLYKCGNYLIQLDRILRVLDEVKPRRVLLHAPDGLKHLYTCLVRLLEIRGYGDVVYSANPGYGACDIPLEEAVINGADLIIHLGHEKYPYIHGDTSIHVEYVPVYLDVEIDQSLVNKLVDELRRSRARRVSLSSTLVDKLVRAKIARSLADKDVEVVEVDPPILGCQYSHVLALEESVDVHIVVAGGIFHPLGLALVARKPVIAVDPYMSKIWNPGGEAERVRRKRIYDVIRAKNSSSLGLIVGARPGQSRPGLVESLRRQAMEKGYRVYVISSSYLTMERLIAIDTAMNLDFYVVTSCPRLPIDDLWEFHKPVLTPGELLMILRGMHEYIYPW